MSCFTFVTGLQFDLSTVAPVPSIGPGPDPEHVGGSWLQPLHRHHVGTGLQNCVVLLPLILKRQEERAKILIVMDL